MDTITNKPVTLYQAEKNHIEKFIMSPKFPWFWQDSQTFDKPEFFNKHLPEWIQPLLSHYNGPFLSHTLLRRSEDANESIWIVLQVIFQSTMNFLLRYSIDL